MPGSVFTTASTAGATSVMRSGWITVETPGTVTSLRLVPMTVAPSAWSVPATARPIPPKPRTSTVWRLTCPIVQRPVHSRSRCRRLRRGRSLAPASTPKTANSASGRPWTPAEVVKRTRSSSSGRSPAALTWLPPPAAMVCTQRRRGLARTARARAAGSTSGTPYRASAESMASS
ncbi:hypothetical protein M271_49020 [Streptomyces rapamycinicus NRRL 5491]|nr:hypothetical protein M271_49020 [Streptomyces rapamycinicus NRRL 5491]